MTDVIVVDTAGIAVPLEIKPEVVAVQYLTGLDVEALTMVESLPPWEMYHAAPVEAQLRSTMLPIKLNPNKPMALQVTQAMHRIFGPVDVVQIALSSHE